MQRFFVPFATVACVSFASTALAQLSVVAVSPTMNASNVSPTATIAIDFDRALAPSSIPPATNDVKVFGSISGPVPGVFALENGNARVRFTPSHRFAAGEVVEVACDHDLTAADATHLRTAGFTWRFRVRTQPAPRTLTQINDVLLRQNPNVSVRIYGGNACDLNRDGFADMPLACEDACDVRVLLNRPDCSGIVQPLLLPTNPVGCTPSPNECCELNGDGFVDIVTANPGGNSMSVLLGNGDGSFQPSTTYVMGTYPAGLAVLDVDGDGDTDVVTVNNVPNNMTLRRNDGSGAFGPATTFDSGWNGEYGLTSSDMNEDGILDLVVGARTDARVVIMLGNGTGTFTTTSSTPCGGAAWMITCGDVNGDGHVDVSCANSSSSNGSILYGNGAGGLTLGPVVPMAGTTIATDLGDMDGDGDLDWMLSSFGGGEWKLWVNDGSGGYAFGQQFTALSNPACSALYDFDDDGDLDAVLLDEIADHATFFRNGTPAGTPMCFGDGTGGACPCGNVGAAGHGCANSANAQGALLTVAGQANPDTAVLCATGMPSAAATIFLRGSALEASPAIFHDGLRCAGGALVRFGAQTAVNGGAMYPGSFANTLSGISGTTPGSGVTYWYQGFYRNASATFCPPATANATNGVVVTW